MSVSSSVASRRVPVLCDTCRAAAISGGGRRLVCLLPISRLETCFWCCSAVFPRGRASLLAVGRDLLGGRCLLRWRRLGRGRALLSGGRCCLGCILRKCCSSARRRRAERPKPALPDSLLPLAPAILDALPANTAGRHPRDSSGGRRFRREHPARNLKAVRSQYV